MSSDQPSKTVDALAILTIPRLHAITERQVRGIACVWDAIPLTPAIAVDLGARKATRAGATVTWYPRACRSCVASAAATQRAMHALTCEPCRGGDETGWCDKGRALSGLLREHQR